MADGIEMSRSGGHSNLRIQAGARVNCPTGRLIAGAAAGPKWLILNHGDRFLFGDRITGRKSPLHLVGSSSGAGPSRRRPKPTLWAPSTGWGKPYIAQPYDHHPAPAAVSREVWRTTSTPGRWFS